MSYQYYTKGYSGTLHSIYTLKVVNRSWKYKIDTGYVVSDFACPNNRCWQAI